MKLKDILKGIKYDITGDEELEINQICENTSQNCENSLFVAIRGFTTDGHKYINDAINKGAKVVAVEKDYEGEIDNKATVVRIENTRKALATMSANFYNNPSKELKVIGITGTKGKTTTSYMIKTILEHHGYKVGLIGTIEKLIGSESLGDSDRTTPRKLRTSRTVKTNGW